MKLRIRDNSVRLRLTRTEVDELAGNGSVVASTGFPDGNALRYSVHRSAGLEAPAARFSDGELRVELPASVVADWASSETVSIQGEQPIQSGTLSLLVEKDFACLAPRSGEDESDMFEHPEAGSRTC